MPSPSPSSASWREARSPSGRTYTTPQSAPTWSIAYESERRVWRTPARPSHGFAPGSSFCNFILLCVVKLMCPRYYRIFTILYATSLLFSECTMTNSSWTQAHIQSLLTLGRSSFLASVLLLDEQSASRKQARARAGVNIGKIAECEVVYPPCDTAGLKLLGSLGSRKREIVSLAQFRCVLTPESAVRTDDL